MLIMKSKRKKAPARDGFVQGELPFLWPDENGSLSLERPYFARSSGSRLQRLQLTQHAARVSRLHLPRTRSLFLWLLERSSAAIGFGKVKESRFEMWLLRRLEEADFNAIEVIEVTKDAIVELELDRETVLRFLVRGTRSNGDFRSDGHIVTFR